MSGRPGQFADTEADAEADTHPLLGQLAEHTGEPVPPAWEKAFREVPRHAFLPDRLWLRGHRPGAVSVPTKARVGSPDEPLLS